MAHVAGGSKDFSTKGVVKRNFADWKTAEFNKRNAYGLSWAAQGGGWNPLQWYNTVYKLNRQRKLVKSLKIANRQYEHFKQSSPAIVEIGNNAFTGAHIPTQIKTMDELARADHSDFRIQLDPVHQMQALMGTKDSIARTTKGSSIKPGDMDKLEVLTEFMNEKEKSYFKDGLITAEEAHVIEQIVNAREKLLADYGTLTRQMVAKGRTVELGEEETKLLHRSKAVKNMATTYAGLLRKNQIQWVARQRYYRTINIKEQEYKGSGKGIPERERTVA
ncbi:MAG: hypothetical protein NUV57_02355 [archaeon]|nr:hypothetical protein [archaeon]